MEEAAAPAEGDILSAVAAAHPRHRVSWYAIVS